MCGIGGGVVRCVSMWAVVLEGLRLQLDWGGANNVERNDGRDKERPKLQVVHLLVCAAGRHAATSESSARSGLWDGMVVSTQRHSQLSVNTSLFAG